MLLKRDHENNFEFFLKIVKKISSREKKKKRVMNVEIIRRNITKKNSHENETI